MRGRKSSIRPAKAGPCGVSGLGRLLSFLVLCLATAPVAANDSTAGLGAGGLVLTKTADIDMRAEDLSISTRQIRVRYRFFNTSKHDIATQVAFPLPDLVYKDQDSSIDIPNSDGDNFLGFVTRVNGMAVKMQLEQKAMAKDIDHSALLRQLGLPLSFYTDAAHKALQALPKPRWDELVALGLAEIVEFDEGKGMEKTLQARWLLKSTYHWEQVFPAQREIAIEHTYKPSVSSKVETQVGGSDWKEDPAGAEYFKNYCIDAKILTLLAKAHAKDKSSNSPFAEERIDYILTTGANWAAPIGVFRLVIDKGSVANLTSVCGTGWKAISPTRFELRKRNFTPTEDFHMLIFKLRETG